LTATRSNPAFLILGSAAFISGANLRMFDTLLPTLAEDFGVAPTVASIVVTAFTFSYGVFQLVHGPLGDRVGRLRTVALAMLIACLGSLGSGLAPNLGALTALRFVTGIGAAGIIPVAIAWIGDHTSYENRQHTLARFIGFSISGQILGPAMGGALAEWLSWREVFYLLTAAFLIVAAALFMLDRREKRNGGAPKPHEGENLVRTYLAILRVPWVRTVLLVVFLEGALFYGAFAYVGAWLKETFDLSYLVIGIMMAGFGIGGLAYAWLVRRLLRRLGETGFAIGAAFVFLAFFACLPFSPVWQVTGPLCALGGFGFYMLHNTLQTKATEMYPSARGTAISAFALCLFCGQAAGVALFGRSITWLGYAPSFVFTGVALLLLAILFARQLRLHAAGAA
jgi:MFS transporter, YNFM family, putative membrane transport protein